MASLPAAFSLRRLRHTGKSAGSAADHYQENRAGSKKAETPPAAKETPAPAETPEPAPQKEEQPAPEPAAPEGKKSKYPVFEYPYNLETDRQNFDYNNIDIVVGDKRYMTQINDWFMNFRDYKDKTVLIEGYFISINGHYFVGRNGPTCPYCTGGYVDFEFTSDGDFTGYEDGVTWIKVYGILREATVHLNDHLTAPFYHLEAVKVEKWISRGSEPSPIKRKEYLHSCVEKILFFISIFPFMST